MVKPNRTDEELPMAKIRESRRKAEQRQFSLVDNTKKHHHNNLSISEKEALREICSRDFKLPIRHGRHY